MMAKKGIIFEDFILILSHTQTNKKFKIKTTNKMYNLRYIKQKCNFKIQESSKANLTQTKLIQN